MGSRASMFEAVVSWRERYRYHGEQSEAFYGTPPMRRGSFETARLALTAKIGELVSTNRSAFDVEGTIHRVTVEVTEDGDPIGAVGMPVHVWTETPEHGWRPAEPRDPRQGSMPELGRGEPT